jgi:LL-diaminopimelate aminotransferase
MQRNHHLSLLASNYLFPTINLRKREYLEQCPEAQLINLGIGDTTEPLPLNIAKALSEKALAMSTTTGYTGYGAEQGSKELRHMIATRFYGNSISADDIFISDGAKCDLGRLQMMFGHTVSIAVPDPAYPVYREGSILQGVQNIVSMPCTAANGLFPDLEALPRTDLIYFCSPNNPTGTVATHEQLQQLVALAKKRRSIIIFDSAYASYIRDTSLPRSIYEIEGANTVAIEVNSFSKMAGFSGLRLGWTVIPSELSYDDGSSVRNDWHRLTSTIFNGASSLVQSGALAVLGDEGWEATCKVIDFYMDNAALLKAALQAAGYTVFGGENCPYLWVHFPGTPSWNTFQYLLEELHLVTTPGIGFGCAGEEFIRFSAFGRREAILQATERLQQTINSSLVRA